MGDILTRNNFSIHAALLMHPVMNFSQSLGADHCDLALEAKYI